MEKQKISYLDMPKEEVLERKRAVEAAIKVLEGMDGDASVFKDGTGALLDVSLLPEDVLAALKREGAALEGQDRKGLLQFLQVAIMKMDTSERIREIKRTASFNRVACSVLFDNRPGPGSLEALFAPRGRK